MANEVAPEMPFPPNSHSFGTSTHVPTIPIQTIPPKLQVNPLEQEPYQFQPMSNNSVPSAQQHLKHTPPKSEEAQELPNNVSLLLKLVLDYQSADNLSIPQIDSLLKYFENVKQTILSRCSNERSINNLPDQQQNTVLVIPSSSTASSERSIEVDDATNLRKNGENVDESIPSYIKQNLSKFYGD